jgi:hypothetical protein
LEQVRHVPQPIAAPLEHFELVIEPFDKTAGLIAGKVVRNQVEPALQQLQEWIKAP